VNLEEARSVAKWLSEDVDYMDIYGDFPAYDSEKEHQDVIAAIILELADEVERMREHYHIVGTWCAYCGKPGYAKEGRV
jgi:hypothetical protein